MVKTTRHICEYAAKKNMLVKLEVFGFDMAKKSLIGHAPLAMRFAAEMRMHCNNFGLLVDLSLILSGEEEIAEETLARDWSLMEAMAIPAAEPAAIAS